jgi:hypothetical protein
MQLMLGVLKKKLKHDLKHDVEELDLPQATTASRILKDRRPDVTFYLSAGHPLGCRGPMRRASASWLKDSKKKNITRTTHQKWAGTAQKTGIEADVINAINSISPSSSWDCSAPALGCGGAFFICAKVPAAWRCSPQCAAPHSC